ncbi:MAG: cell division protein ZapA [Nitrospirae bacterium]|nr:cell division protein ZapA [Nitrospirota bacterium]
MKSVEVQILGQNYSIKTDDDEAYIKELARYVDGKLKEIYNAAPNASHVKVAIMASLGIADELFRERAERKSFDRMIEEKTKALSALLEE